MLKRLKTALSLWHSKQMPVIPVISHVRYVQAVVDNLPDNRAKLRENTPVLLNLVQLVAEKDLAAGGAALQALVKKGQQFYRGKMVAEVTAAEVLGKTTLAQANQQMLEELTMSYEASKF